MCSGAARFEPYHRPGRVGLIETDCVNPSRIFLVVVVVVVGDLAAEFGRR